MKKFIIALILGLISIMSYGQEIKFNSGQVLYCIHEPNISYTNKQYIPNSAIVKTKNIIPTKWKILKFTNIGNDLTKNYDAVIIQAVTKLEKKLYLIKYEDLGEYKYLIDNANNLLTEKYSFISNEISNLKDSITFYKNIYCADTLKNNQAYRDSSRIYKDNINRYNHFSDSLISDFQKYSINLYYHTKDSVYKSFSPKLKDFVNKINIIDFFLGAPNSVGGHDLWMRYTNLNEKTIKYFTFNCDYYNGVNDKVYCDIQGTNLDRLKDTGPIEINSNGGGNWDCVIYNYSAKYAIIKSINIIYMDGSKYSIAFTKNEFEQVLNYFNLINKDINKVINDNIKKLNNSHDKNVFELNNKIAEFNYNRKSNNKLAFDKFDKESIRLNKNINKLNDLNNTFYEVGIYDNFEMHIINN